MKKCTKARTESAPFGTADTFFRLQEMRVS